LLVHAQQWTSTFERIRDCNSEPDYFASGPRIGLRRLPKLWLDIHLIHALNETGTL
jgi:hypothetical protein